MTKLSVSQLASLAQESEVADSLPWGLLTVDKITAYELMASQVIEMTNNMTGSQKEMVMMATMTRLLVENFVLNTRLMLAEKST